MDDGSCRLMTHEGKTDLLYNDVILLASIMVATHRFNLPIICLTFEGQHKPNNRILWNKPIEPNLPN